MEKYTITVAALGPDSGELLTRGALEAMRSADTLVLRTARHGVSAVLEAQGIPYCTLDPLYEQTEDFEELCALAADALIEKVRKCGALCYAVSDPVSDATVRTLAGSLPEDIRLETICGVTLAENAACAVLAYGVNTENLRTLTSLSAGEIPLHADSPLVITEIDTKWIASDVKLWLTELYDDEMTVYFLENAAQPCPEVRPIPLEALDRQPAYDHRTAVLLPAVSVYDRRRADYDDFAQVIRRLVAPGGCPWDRAQTHHTLRQYMIGEACEAAEAMDGDDPDKLADELGDVLLQVVLNSALAENHGEFTDRDVITMSTRKMIRRHEHVFGNAKADTPEATGIVWENAKRKERGMQTPLERAGEVPASLPGLMRSQKVQKRLYGDALTREGTRAQLAAAAAAAETEDAGEETLGKLLEACCAWAQARGLDAETALRSATGKRLSGDEK